MLTSAISISSNLLLLLVLDFNSASWVHFVVDGSDKFVVAECYSKLLQLRRKFFDPAVYPFQWSSVWINHVPSKVCFLAWLLVRERVLTHEGLQRRGFSLCSKCYLCRADRETNNHLFVACPWTKKVWDYFAKTAVPVLQGDKFSDRLLVWDSTSATCQGSILRSCVPHAILWVMWNERNKRCFEEVEVSWDKLILSVKECIWSWCRDLNSMKNLRFELDVISCNF